MDVSVLEGGLKRCAKMIGGMGKSWEISWRGVLRLRLGCSGVEVIVIMIMAMVIFLWGFCRYRGWRDERGRVEVVVGDRGKGVGTVDGDWMDGGRVS